MNRLNQESLSKEKISFGHFFYVSFEELEAVGVLILRPSRGTIFVFFSKIIFTLFLL